MFHFRCRFSPPKLQVLFESGVDQSVRSLFGQFHIDLPKTSAIRNRINEDRLSGRAFGVEIAHTRLKLIETWSMRL